MSNMVGSHLLNPDLVLIIAARTVGGRTCLEEIEEMDSELTKVIEEFGRAVDVDTLRIAKRSGEYSLHQLTWKEFNLSSFV